MLNLPNREDIRWLFDEVWTWMEYSAKWRDNCLDQFERIHSLFGTFANEPDILLQTLDTLDGGRPSHRQRIGLRLQHRQHGAI
jgi:hypothetical protein